MRIILYTVNELRKRGICEYYGLSPRFYNEIAYRSRKKRAGLKSELTSIGSYHLAMGAYVRPKFVKEIINDED